MRKNKVGNRKYIRKILQIEDNWDAIFDIMSANSLQEVLYIVEKELDKRFSVIESKLFLVDNEFNSIFNATLEIKKYLEKETTYLDEEGILDWVNSSLKTQVVPSPFYSYGKASVIITPIYDNDMHIGFFISLSKNNRLLFNDIQISNIDKLIKLFNSKLVSLFHKQKLKELVSNIDYYENIILSNPNYIDKQLLLESTSEKISQSLNIVKNNINLIDKNAENFYTRLNKVSSEVDNIIDLNNRLNESNLRNNDLEESKTSIDDIINEILEVMEHEFQSSNLEISFAESEPKYYICSSKGKFRSAIINLLVYILNQDKQYNTLNIYYKTNNHAANISFYLGVENYSFTANITLDSPIEIKTPKELEITKKLLTSMGSSLNIIYVEELGYFFNILLK